MNITNVNNGKNPYAPGIVNAEPARTNNTANPQVLVNKPMQEDIFTMSPEAVRIQNQVPETQGQEQRPTAVIGEENPTAQQTNPSNENLALANKPLANIEENPEPQEKNPTGEQPTPANNNLSSANEPLVNVRENQETPEPNKTNQQNLAQQRARAVAMGMPNPGNILDLNA